MLSDPAISAVRLSAPIFHEDQLAGIIQWAISLQSLHEKFIRPIKVHKGHVWILDEQVLLNLITNAAQAMERTRSPKKIRIASAQKNGRIIVKVSSSGPGVPLAIRDKILDPFYTTKSDSSGIGLALTNRIVTDHGGSLQVTDRRWKGAEFIMEIPIRRGPART